MRPELNTLEFLDKITSIKPTQLQIDFQNMGYYNFIHFGLNTFTSKEWGDGKVNPSVFTLKHIDTDKWVKQLKGTGSKCIIITSKHHDGFCLFRSEYTDYCIKSTNYEGDLVGQLAESCKKYGMKLGIYLSPWDRHEQTYGTEEYNDYFCNQLTELCTNYGEIACFWFDGACGEGPNGKKQRYDWKRYFDTIHKLQPNALLSICGPDIRWIGNENGKCRASEFSVVPKSMQNQDYIAENSQQEAGAAVMFNKPSETDELLGGREQLYGNELCWYPAEMDVSVTRMGWFWRKSFELFQLRSVENLEQCYYDSVGNNAMLLLNVAPNKKGELPKRYIKRIMQTKAVIEKRFENRIKCTEKSESDFKKIFEMTPQAVKTIVLSEDVNFSQRVEKFKIASNGETVFEGTTIGFKKICILKKPVNNCEKLEIIIDECRKEPVLREVKIYG